jgi:hypothetical protein
VSIRNGSIYARLSRDGLSVLCGAIQARLHDRAPLLHACDYVIGTILQTHKRADPATEIRPGIEWAPDYVGPGPAPAPGEELWPWVCVRLLEFPSGFMRPRLSPRGVMPARFGPWQMDPHEVERLERAPPGQERRPHGRGRVDAPPHVGHSATRWDLSALARDYYPVGVICPKCTKPQLLDGDVLRVTGMPRIRGFSTEFVAQG